MSAPFRKFFLNIRTITSPERPHAGSGGKVLKEGLVFYIKYMAFAFCVIVLVLAVSRLLGIEIKNVMSTDSHREQVQDKLIFWLLQLSLFGPLIEEIIFRLWLSFRRGHIAVSVFVLSYVILTLSIPHAHDVYVGSVQSDYFEHVLLKVTISVLLSLCILFISQERIDNITAHRKHQIILVSLFAFALLHLGNARCAWYIYPLMTIMCLPQLILGTTVTYYRLHRKFATGLIFHCMVNLATAMISYKDFIMEGLTASF